MNVGRGELCEVFFFWITGDNSRLGNHRKAGKREQAGGMRKGTVEVSCRKSGWQGVVKEGVSEVERRRLLTSHPGISLGQGRWLCGIPARCP